MSNLNIDGNLTVAGSLYRDYSKAITQLYSSTSVSTGSKTLSSVITDYRWLVFEVISSSGGTKIELSLPTYIFINSNNSSTSRLVLSTDMLYLSVYYSSEKTIYIYDMHEYVSGFIMYGIN